ncbi:MAG: hypothetical protein AAGA73_10460 [Pseudomonadota bacterium]
MKSPRFGEQWLSQHQLGYVGLDDDDRTAIREFALLWGIFESQALFGDGTIDGMNNYIDEIARIAEADQRVLLTAPFIPHVAHFRDQYVDSERATTNGAFETLNFKDTGSKVLVRRALVTLNEETPELVKALLIIVYHLRRRLFQGLKWQRTCDKQRDDLYHASKVLMKAVDMSIA